MSAKKIFFRFVAKWKKVVLQKITPKELKTVTNDHIPTEKSNLTHELQYKSNHSAVHSYHTVHIKIN